MDAVSTADGRMITAAATVFNTVEGVLRGQLVQHDVRHLCARVLPTPSFTEDQERRLRHAIRAMVGLDITIAVERVAGPDDFGPPGVKHRAVVSDVTRDAVALGRPLP